MSLTEPTTMITDYLVAGLSIYFWWRLWLDSGERRGRSERWWSWAFLATAVGALAGGTSHGLTVYLGETGWLVLWKVTVYALAVASLCLLVAALLNTFRGWALISVLILAWLKFGLYALFMMREDDFDYVIYDYGSTMIVVLLLQVWSWIRHRSAAAGWIIAGILVSFAASQIQMSGWSLHRHFNHNDIFHVIEMLGLALLYRGGLLLEDAT